MLFDKKGNNPVLAVGYLFKGLKLLASPELRTFIIIPVLINVVLYSAALTLGYFYISDLINSVYPRLVAMVELDIMAVIFYQFFYRRFFYLYGIG